MTEAESANPKRAQRFVAEMRQVHLGVQELHICTHNEHKEHTRLTDRRTSLLADVEEVLNQRRLAQPGLALDHQLNTPQAIRMRQRHRDRERATHGDTHRLTLVGADEQIKHCCEERSLFGAANRAVCVRVCGTTERPTREKQKHKQKQKQKQKQRTDTRK